MSSGYGQTNHGIPHLHKALFVSVNYNGPAFNSYEDNQSIAMKIIKVRKADVNVINDILVHHIDTSDRKEALPTLTHLQTLLDDNRSYLFAAVNEDVVVGYALAYRFPSLYASEYLAYLYDIEVSENHRRKGVGTLLIKTILEHLRRDNVKELWLGTGIENQEGQALFSSTGAVKSQETFNDYTYYLS